MIDGASYDVMSDLLASGDLPALPPSPMRGGGLKKAVTCFPSTTGPAYIPYFMGLFPGTANVPGYRWLSRAGYDDAGSRWTRPGLASYSGREAMSFDPDLPADMPTWFDYFGSHRNVLNLLTKGSTPPTTSRGASSQRSTPLATTCTSGSSPIRWPRGAS